MQREPVLTSGFLLLTNAINLALYVHPVLLFPLAFPLLCCFIVSGRCLCSVAVTGSPWCTHAHFGILCFRYSNRRNGAETQLRPGGPGQLCSLLFHWLILSGSNSMKLSDPQAAAVCQIKETVISVARRHLTTYTN